MSTRGAYGFKINNQEKILFSRSDSYLEGLGKDIVVFLKKVDLSRLKSKVKKLQKVPKDYENKNPLFQLDLWNNPQEVLNQTYSGVLTLFFDAQNFVEDVIFCEYFYLINLDNETLEIYQMGRNIFLGQFNLNNIPENWLELIKIEESKFEKMRSEFYLKLLDSKNKKP